MTTSPSAAPIEQNLISLIYASSAVRHLSAEELLAILTKAREKNGRLGITGMLLYKNGNFLQALEGSEKAVTDLLAVIRQDPRHYEIMVIAKRPIQQRDFSEWKMGFVDLNNPEIQAVPGFSVFLKESLDSERITQNPSIAYEFLLTFKEGMR